jgi:hypothetical protein
MRGESEAQKRHTSQVSKSFLELCCFLADENAHSPRKSNAAQKVLEPRVGAERIEARSQ